MAWRPRPRRIHLDGTDAVVLTPDDYERLDSIRRQAGAQAVRRHELREQLAAATAVLDQIASAAVRPDCPRGTDGRAPACLRENIREILAGPAAASPARLPGTQPGREPGPGGGKPA